MNRKKAPQVTCSTKYYNSNRISDFYKFYIDLGKIINEIKQTSRPILFLCIGTDRATGDCLGPLIGRKLSRALSKQAIIYGTLSHPVHARNLKSTIQEINLSFNNPFIIAIDASLGTKEHIGYVTLSKQQLQPGIGVHKTLPAVGEVCITGIVGMLTYDSQASLQGTRLSLVVQIVGFIANAILRNFADSPTSLKHDYLTIL